MPRVKKTRKVTKSLPRAKPKLPKAEIQKKPRKTSGKAPGNRNSLVEEKARSSQPGGTGANMDKRLGSKKKISLFGNKEAKEENNRLIPKFKAPQEELNYIENDKRLQNLVDKLDQGKSISPQDQHYVDHLLNRHKVLCDLLGIAEENDSDIEEDTPDLLDRLEQPFSDRY